MHETETEREIERAGREIEGPSTNHHHTQFAHTHIHGINNVSMGWQRKEKPHKAENVYTPFI